MMFRVGRLVGETLEPAFTVARMSGGGVRITDAHNVTSREHHLILAHYGRMIHGKSVLRDEQHIRVFRPGSAKHFEQSSYRLPPPFGLLPRTA